MPQPFTRAEVFGYATHRIGRVIPLFYLAVTAGLLFHVYPVTAENAAAHYALVDGVSVLWTIPVECQFYVAFVAMWWLWTRSEQFTIILTLVWVAIYFMLGRKFIPNHTVLFYAAYFVAGVLIGALCHDAKPRHKIASPIFVLSAAAMLCLFPNVGRLAGINFETRWDQPADLIAVAAFFMATLYSPLAKVLLGNRVMVFSGRVSYSVYLLHVPVLEGLSAVGIATWHPLLFTVLGFAVTVALAAISFYCIERPTRLRINALAP